MNFFLSCAEKKYMYICTILFVIPTHANLFIDKTTNNLPLKFKRILYLITIRRIIEYWPRKPSRDDGGRPTHKGCILHQGRRLGTVGVVHSYQRIPVLLWGYCSTGCSDLRTSHNMMILLITLGVVPSTSILHPPY